MSFRDSSMHICTARAELLPTSCMPLCVPRPRLCCSSTTCLLSMNEKPRSTLGSITNWANRPEFSRSSSKLPSPPEPPSHQSSLPNITRSSSRMSDIYDRMFPDPPPLTSAPLLLSPIETIDVAQLGHCGLNNLSDPENVSESTDISDTSTPPLPPLEAFENAKAGYRSVLSTTPTIGIDMPLTPPFTPGRPQLPLPTPSLASPFTPRSIYAPQSNSVDYEQGREGTLSPPTSDRTSANSPQPTDIAQSTSVSIHSPDTPQYSARLIRRTRQPSPSPSSMRVFQFPLVPGSTASPGAFSLKTCNAWIDNLATPSTSRSRNTSGVSQLSSLVTPSLPSRSVDSLLPPQKHIRHLAEDWTATMDITESPAEDLPTLDVRHDVLSRSPTPELQEEISVAPINEDLDVLQINAVLPELQLPDWTLDIRVSTDDLQGYFSQRADIHPLRGILRQPSTDRVNLLTPARSVKWAPDETLEQMRYIAVDGHLFGVDEHGMRRPLTEAEEVQQAEYERYRQWI